MKSEQNANRLLAQTANKIPGNLTFIRVSPPCQHFSPKRLTTFAVAKVLGVNPYNDTRGMAVRS